MKILAAFCILMAFSGASFALDSPSDMPSVPESADSTGGWSYWLARKTVLDIDQMLQTQGIKPVVCTYRNFTPAQDTSYKGIGPCLFENFKKSMKSDELVGVIYTWIQDKDQNFHPIEIRWRPPHGGWMKVIRQAIEMKFEKPLYSVRSFFGSEESANKLRYDEFLAGEMNIILPDDPKAIEALIASGNTWLVKYAQDVKDIGFALKATGSEQGKVIYQGQIQVGMRSENGETENHLDIKTNINILVLDRKFFVKGHMQTGELKSNAPSAEMPMMPTMGIVP